jgi:two-component system sensor histidine kinase AgrC
MFLCFQFLISPELIKSPIYFTFLFLLVILIILNVFLIYIVSTLDTKNNENKNLELQLNTVNILSDELREFKHNYLNILNSIGGYVNNNNMKDLKEYFQEVLNQADKIKYSNLFALTRLKISSISGILINTINKANKNNILLKLDISENVTLKTNFNLYNLSEIVGILFDNSIEAAVKTDEELVKITIQNIKDGLLIEISNSYNIEPDVSKIFNKGYSTKENPSGLGLYYVKKILKDYPLSSLNTEFENGLFKQSLFIK